MSELAVRDDTAVASRIPAPQLPVPAMNDIDSWTQIMSKVIMLANEIYDTPFVPDGLRGSAAAVSAAILTGREMGLGPMTSLANIDVIRGKPTQKPLLMRAMILSQGHKWVDVDVSDTRVVVKGCRKGESEWTEVTFTDAMARKGGIDLGKYPADKLYARASSRLAKRRFADVIIGMPYTADDAEDGLGDEVDTATGELTTGTAAAIEPAKPKTAQRRTRQAADRPTGAASATASGAASGSAAPASDATAPSGDGLPPLPGEDEAPPPPAEPAAVDAPGDPVSSKRLTAIWTAFTKDFGVSSDDSGREEVRTACGLISGRGADLSSSKNLTNGDASTVLDTLAHLRAQAAERDASPRELLLALLEQLEEAATGGE